MFPSADVLSFDRVPPTVFIRDDDVWTPDSVFKELLGFLKKQKIPVIYGIIPDRLEEAMVRLLRKEKKQHPGSLDIVQHGFAHKNYGEGMAKYEFGQRRSYHDQHDDILKGLTIMRRRFAQYWTPGFIPPYHGYDNNTLKVIRSLKIPLFSSGARVVCDQKTFIDLPAAISLNEYDANSTPKPFDFRHMLNTTLRTLRPGKVFGMVYHHRAIKTESDMRAIKMFLRLLADWRAQKELRIVLFSDILEGFSKGVSF
ncbi:MAG: DUF2334 domain-containing protein [Candidatus Omnitrophica bacterium]|nr:DUF2334 domain-containing protein [Candidatus Omnitrophota bacterium]